MAILAVVCGCVIEPGAVDLGLIRCSCGGQRDADRPSGTCGAVRSGTHHLRDSAPTEADCLGVENSWAAAIRMSR